MRQKWIFYARCGKRCFDLVVTITGIVLLTPALCLIAILVKLQMGHPVLFRQVRPGLYGRPFTLYKFRTMTDARDACGNLLSNDRRITPLGRVLRSTSIDELPELLNVLKGEMSLVGPRPLLIEYLKLYSEEQVRRQDVKPGITGLAQINGRNSISWEEKFKNDVLYVEKLSFRLDVKIVVLTLIKVLRKEGINESKNVTMPRFLGSDK